MRFRWADSLVSCGRKADSCNNICGFKNIRICVNEARNTGYHDFSITSHWCMEEIQRSFALMSRMCRKAKQSQQASRNCDGSRWTHWLLHCDETLKSSSHLTKPNLTVGLPSVMLHFTGSLLRFPSKQVGAVRHLPQKSFSRSPLSGYKQNSPKNGKVNKQRTF